MPSHYSIKRNFPSTQRTRKKTTADRLALTKALLDRAPLHPINPWTYGAPGTRAVGVQLIRKLVASGYAVQIGTAIVSRELLARAAAALTES